MVSSDGDAVSRKQLKILEDIKSSTNMAAASRVKEDAGIKDITRAKSTRPSVVTLGNVRDELKNINDSVKKELPSAGGQGGLDALRDRVREDGGLNSTDLLKKLGGISDLKSEIEEGGSRNELLTAKNQETFQKFISETKNRSELLGGANAEQVEIFKKIQETLVELQSAGTKDSAKLRQNLSTLAGEFRETQESTSKKTLEGIIANTRASADVGRRGNQGTLGDAFAALTGKKTVLKSGFEYDSRISGKDGAAGIRNTETGKLAGAGQAGMGRVAGFASILGNFVGNKIEQSVEGKRSERVQGFLDNFRTSSRKDDAAYLQGQSQSLLKSLQSGGAATQASSQPDARSSAQIIPFPGGAKKQLADAGNISQAIKSSLKNLRVQSIKIEAANVELSGALAQPQTPDSGNLKSDVKYSPFDDKAANDEQDGPGGGIMDSLGDLFDINGRKRRPGRRGRPSARPKPGGRSRIPRIPGSIPGAFGAVAVPTTVAAIGAGLTYGATGVLASENMAGNRKALQENSMLGAMGGDTTAASSILDANQGKDYREVRKEQQTEKEKLKNAPWYTRLYGIGRSDYLKKQEANQQKASVMEKSQNSMPSAQPRAPEQNSGTAVTTVSNQNSQAKMEAAKPRVIVAPQPAAPTAPPVTNVTNNMGRGRVRPEESHLERYQARTSGSFIY